MTKFIKAFRVFFIVAVTASVVISMSGGAIALAPVGEIAASAFAGTLGLAAAKFIHFI